MDYKNGNKNNWRRWTWNRLAERIKKKEDAIVLYLPGPLALDRLIGIEKGFKKENLIAVENDPRTLLRLRAQGLLCIDGEMSDVMMSWPFDKQVGGVIGDFCCGLESKLISRLIDAILFHPAFVDCVFAFNFLRGRDPSSNLLRSEIHNRIQRPIKHRGLLFLAMLYWKFVDFTEKRGWLEAERLTFLDKWEMSAMPKFRSYHSSSQVFDSIVFFNAFLTVAMLAANTLEDAVRTRRELIGSLSQIDWGKGSPTRRNSAAILAHKTMRIDG